jgi:hypothetical protein
MNGSMLTDHERISALDDARVRRFIEGGFIRLDNAFPRELADASFPGDDGSWRLNVKSEWRALLMLFLSSKQTNTSYFDQLREVAVATTRKGHGLLFSRYKDW